MTTPKERKFTYRQYLDEFYPNRPKPDIEQGQIWQYDAKSNIEVMAIAQGWVMFRFSKFNDPQIMSEGRFRKEFTYVKG
jgi:hypothetical protein